MRFNKVLNRDYNLIETKNKINYEMLPRIMFFCERELKTILMRNSLLLSQKKLSSHTLIPSSSLARSFRFALHKVHQRLLSRRVSFLRVTWKQKPHNKFERRKKSWKVFSSPASLKRLFPHTRSPSLSSALNARILAWDRKTFHFPTLFFENFSFNMLFVLCKKSWKKL